MTLFSSKQTEHFGAGVGFEHSYNSKLTRERKQKQKPTPLGARVFKRYRTLREKVARKLRISEGEVVHRAIEASAR
jgi:hypothetical protein